MIVMPALAAAGVDVNQLTLSRSSMMDARNNSRELLAGSVRQIFQPMVPLVAHCCLTKIELRGVEKLLGIPTILVGTGQLMGQKIFDCIQE